MMNEIKKGYKQTDIGVIPEDWEVKQVGDIYDLLCGFAFSGTDILNSGAHRLLRGINITEGEIRHNDDIDRFFNNDVSSLNKYFLEIGDLVIGMDGSKVGKNSALITQNDKGALLVQRVARLKSIGNKVSTSYLYLFINSLFFTKYVDGLKTNSAIPHISAKDIKSFLIPIPLTYAEQTAIASALSDVDALISALDKKITKKQQIKQGAMQLLLTGKKRLPGFSGEWVEKNLGEIAEIKDGTHQTPHYVNDGIPFYSVESVTNNDFKKVKTISLEEHKLLTKTYKIEKGDVLMTRIGSIGVCKFINWDLDASFYVSLALLKFKSGFSAQYFTQYSKTSEFIREIEEHSLQHATPKKINLGKISLVKIRLPLSFAEQISIAQILTDMDNEIEKLQADRNKYKQIKAGMMQQLLTGKIRLMVNG